MSVATLVVSFALGPVPAEKAVTDTEKKQFLEMLRQLPHEGEFYTDEAVAKAVPYTRVLLALTDKDLEKRDLYPFLALSRGLFEHKEARTYAVAHFRGIAHPTIKLFWALILFDQRASTPEIVRFLREALKSKDKAKWMEETVGPGFEAFKKRLIQSPEQEQKSGK